MNPDDVTEPAQDPDDCRIPLADEAATAALAARLAPWLTPGSIVFLSGDLGSGKTTFCRALIRSLGYNGRVKSPTFSLVEPYNLSRYTLYHFDFYRFSSEDELREAGFEEQLDSTAVALVEWPEKAAARLAVPDLRIWLEPGDAPDARLARLRGDTGRGRAWLNQLRDAGCCKQA